MNNEDLILKKIRHVELKTKKLVNALVLGNYRAVLKGQGMTFSDFREYVPGDDVRNISWSLIAKTNKPYVKQYEEERELNAYFLVDTNLSMFEGAQEFIKIEQALYSVAALAMAAQKSNDLSSLIFYSKYMRKFIPPKKGKVHVRRLVSEMINVEPEVGSDKGLEEACNLVLKHQKKKSIVFIFSDFLNLTSAARTSLQALAKKHQVVACMLSQAQQTSLPQWGGMRVVDLQSQSADLLNSSSSWMQNMYQKFMLGKMQRREKILKSADLEILEIRAEEDIYKPIMRFFNRKRHS